MGSVQTFVRRARRRAIIERDLRRLARHHGRALAGAERRPRGVALVVSLTEFVYQLKLEGVLANALARKGLTPVAVVPAGSTVARRYFRVFGVDRFVELGQYVDEGSQRLAAEEAERLLRATPSLSELKRLTFRGAQIGKQVLSTISRVLHEGSIDLSEPRARALLAELLPTALRSTCAAEALIDDLDPELLLFNERNYAFEAPLSDVALERDINVVQFVSAFQDDAFVFKRYTKETRSLHPRSLSDDSWQRVRRLEWTAERDAELEEEFRRRYDGSWALSQRIQGWTRPRPRGEIVQALGLDPARSTAVVFSHVLWDANMFYGEDLFADQEEWFVETVRAACANDRVNWIVKLHPANVWKLRRDGVDQELGDLVVLRERLGEPPAHVRVLRPESDISTRSIFDVADYGITIRGTVGVELPCFGVPVLTAGTGFYSGRGFTVDSSCADEYLARLREIESIPPLTDGQVELARRHAYALFRLRPTRFTSFRSTFRPLEEIGHPLDPDLVLTVSSPEELERAEDLRRFADWAADSRDLDYLELPR